MNLQNRDPLAHELARKLSERKKTAMTEAVIGALEAAWRRAEVEKPLKERVRPIIDELAALVQPGGRDMTKDEIDEMWGH